MNRTPTIDPEFSALCRKLTTEEYEFLENSITAEGCTDSIIAWDQPPYPILDGHTRHEICLNHEKDFDVIYRKFTDRNAARNWIIRHQLGKRNVTEAEKSYLRGKLYSAAKQQHGGDRKSSCQSGILKTTPEIAAETGVSARTLDRDESFAEHVDAIAATSPTVADALRAGEIPKSAAPALAEATKADLAKVAKAKTKPARKAAAKKIVEKASEPDKTEEVKDAKGNIVDEKYREVFTRGRAAFAEALNLEKQLMKAMNAIAADKVIGVYFAAKAVDKEAIEHLNKVRRNLRFAAPHAVCPYCKGTGVYEKKKCPACYGLGWVTEAIAKSGREAVGK
jgi:uncharacterized protein with PIN domain